MSLPLPTRSNGQIIDESWFNAINTEAVDINARLIAKVTGDAIEFFAGGYYSAPGIKTSLVGPHLLTQAITITSALMKVFTAGASGNLEIDIEFKRGAGAWTSIFDIKPKIPTSAGDNADSDTGAGATAAEIDTTVEELEVGDLLRLNTTIIPGGTPVDFLVNLHFDVTGAV